MESKGTFFILIIVVAVLALTLAALAGYIFLVQGNSNGSEAEATEAVHETAEVPTAEELSTIELYESKKYFNLKNEDPNKIAVIQVGVSLRYFSAFEDDKKLIVAEKIEAYLPKIKEIVGTYFLNVTLDQVKDPVEIQKIKDELKIQINEQLNAGEEEEREYVYEVIFDDWLFQ
ncbi:MAG: flagellar basal body-associated FliL family protein [Clostridiales bacterium]|nr:flagellar basal body-associated FliL family protein [Clostridiales bacterium]